MDPLEAAAQRIREQADAAAGLAAAKRAAANQVPAADPDFDGLVSSFLAKAPASTAENLLHRWIEGGNTDPLARLRDPPAPTETAVSTCSEGCEEQGDCSRFEFRTYGTRNMLTPRDPDSRPGQYRSEDVFAQHTVAVTTEGQLLIVLVLRDNTVLAAGQVESDYSTPELRRVRLGPLVGSATVAEALNEQLPERGHMVGTHGMQTPFSYSERPVYDPSFDYRSVHLQKLAEAMVRTLQDLGVH
jgi:hypothetical protein